MSPLFRTGVHILLAACACWGAAGADAAPAAGNVCELRSRYELTVGSSALVFERGAKPDERIEMRSGQLSVNGAPVTLAGADRGRIAAYESTVRSLIPRVKTLGQRAVDLSSAALREEAASVSPRSAANPRLNARLQARAGELKARIANSTTTREWHGAALNRYSAEIVADVLPIIAGDLAQDALEIAMRGDVAGAAVLQKRATGLRASLEGRIRDRLQVLEPELAKLCVSARQLDALESTLTARLPGGARLDLFEIRG